VTDQGAGPRVADQRAADERGVDQPVGSQDGFVDDDRDGYRDGVIESEDPYAEDSYTAGPAGATGRTPDDAATAGATAVAEPDQPGRLDQQGAAGAQQPGAAGAFGDPGAAGRHAGVDEPLPPAGTQPVDEPVGRHAGAEPVADDTRLGGDPAGSDIDDPARGWESSDPSRPDTVPAEGGVAPTGATAEPVDRVGADAPRQDGLGAEAPRQDGFGAETPRQAPPAPGADPTTPGNPPSSTAVPPADARPGADVPPADAGRGDVPPPAAPPLDEDPARDRLAPEERPQPEQSKGFFDKVRDKVDEVRDDRRRS
jgi:hypothetical protein